MYSHTIKAQIKKTHRPTMAKIKTRLSEKEIQTETARSLKAMHTAKQNIESIVKTGKIVYTISLNRTMIQTTDAEKWKHYLQLKQVGIQ